MRILLVSDTHLGALLNARGPAGWRRADDHHAALERALQPALREQVDLVVHAGDVFDRSRPPLRDVERAGALFQEVAERVPVVGIAGNHDRRGVARWLPHRSLQFTDRPAVYDQDGVRLGLVPFRRDPARFLADARALGKVDLLVCHQAFVGSTVPGFTFQVGRPRDTIGVEHLPVVSHIASGHIHPRQVLQLGESVVVHGGSTERTSFSEADQVKGAVIWSFDRTVDWRFVDHETRPMRTQPEPGVLVRCREEEVEVARRAGAIAVLHSARRALGRTRSASVRSRQNSLFGVAQ